MVKTSVTNKFLNTFSYLRIPGRFYLPGKRVEANRLDKLRNSWRQKVDLRLTASALALSEIKHHDLYNRDVETEIDLGNVAARMPFAGLSLPTKTVEKKEALKVISEAAYESLLKTWEETKIPFFLNQGNDGNWEITYNPPEKFKSSQIWGIGKEMIWTPLAAGLTMLAVFSFGVALKLSSPEIELEKAAEYLLIATGLASVGSLSMAVNGVRHRAARWLVSQIERKTLAEFDEQKAAEANMMTGLKKLDALYTQGAGVTEDTSSLIAMVEGSTAIFQLLERAVETSLKENPEDSLRALIDIYNSVNSMNDTVRSVTAEYSQVCEELSQNPASWPSAILPMTYVKIRIWFGLVVIPWVKRGKTVAQTLTEIKMTVEAEADAIRSKAKLFEQGAVVMRKMRTANIEKGFEPSSSDPFRILASQYEQILHRSEQIQVNIMKSIEDLEEVGLF
ncbi:MAG: hypothetical protein ABIE84_04020 [bacterium]